MNTFEVAYVLLRFPVLTETFIAAELQEVQRQGVHLHLFSLLRPRQERKRPAPDTMTRNVRYAPELTSWRLWRAQLYFLLRSPVTYLALWIRLIRQPYPRTFVRLFLKRTLIFWKAVSLAYELRGISIKLLHTHFAWLSGAAAAVISRLLNIPFTVTVHAYDIYASNDLLCMVAGSASQVVAISAYNKQMVLDMCPGLSQDQISVVHCGIHPKSLVPPIRSNHKGPLSILSVGSLIEKKGHQYLIRACQLLKARGINFQCTIIGEGPDEEFLKQLVHDCNLEEQVILVGACQSSDVLEAYRCSDLFVLACVVAKDGDRDGIPVVLMEAMAMRIPVISTRVSGIPELVRHQDTGWLVPERDAAAIADAIVALMADAVLRTRLVENARTLIEAEFDIERNGLHLVTLFRSSCVQ